MDRAGFVPGPPPAKTMYSANRICKENAETGDEINDESTSQVIGKDGNGRFRTGTEKENVKWLGHQFCAI